MRILVIADIDDFLWKRGSGQADVLLSCGDVSDQLILEAAEAYGCQTIFAVKGNHDTNAAFKEPIVDLHLQTEECGSFTFRLLTYSFLTIPRGEFMIRKMKCTTVLTD
ncbi:hypothetical protein ACFLQR_02600 [Verrucomicrobiota bacterium]